MGDLELSFDDGRNQGDDLASVSEKNGRDSATDRLHTRPERNTSYMA
jgi:hypothetical protein